MNEVSSRMFQFFVELASFHGIPVQRLTEGLPSAPAILNGKQPWYDWEEHVELLRKFEELCGGPEAFDAAMRLGTYHRAVRPYAVVASFLTTARGLFWAGFKWFAPSLFRHLKFGYEELSRNVIRGTIEIPDGYTPSPIFFRLWRASSQLGPPTVGLPEPIVHLEITERRAVYTILLSEERQFFARFRRWFRAVFLMTDVVDELSRFHHELREAYDQLRTSHDQAEVALFRSEQTRRALLDGLPDLIVALGLDGVVREVTGSSRHRLAKAFGSLVGRHLTELPSALPGAPQDLVAQLLRQAHLAGKDGATQGFEFSIEADAERLYFEWRTSILDATTVLCVARDISEQKRLETQLVLSDRMASLGTVAAAVAHEINNPLSSLLINLEAAQRPPDPTMDSSPAQCLNVSLEAARRIRDVVSQLRTFSHPDNSKTGLVDLNELLDSMVRLTAHQLRHRATVVTDYQRPPEVLADQSRLGQVFLNLLVNAAQALPDADIAKNLVRLRTRTGPEGEAIVEVEDTGKGIPPEVLPRIFDPFFTTKPINEGTGLGLSICHRIVTELGGKIEVRTEVGKGSTFRVVLPAAKERPRPAAPAPEPRPQSGECCRRKILIVDDNVRVGLSLKLLLREHEVTVVDSGAEGARRLLDEPFDLALCDLMMPEVDGIELFRRVQRAKPGLERKIVFMTGGAFTPEARAFLESVANERLEKPFQPEQLELIIARAG